MFCEKCGRQINDTAKFCGGCGAKVIHLNVISEQLKEKTIDGKKNFQMIYLKKRHLILKKVLISRMQMIHRISYKYKIGKTF